MINVKNWIIILFVLMLLPLFCIVSLSAQFSDKVDNSFKPMSMQTIRDNENISIACSYNGLYYLGWLTTTKVATDSIIYNYYLQLFDIDGNKIWSTPLSFPLVSNDWKSGPLLVCSPQLAVNSEGECIFVIYGKSTIDGQINTNINFIKVNKDNKTSMVTSHNVAGEIPEHISFKLNNEDNIYYAIDYLNRVDVAVINNMTLPETVVSVEGATQPGIVLAKDLGFYLVYKIDNRLFANKYDKNGQMIWMGKMIGDAKMSKHYLMEADGQGGFVVLWDTDNNLLLQHIDTNGTRLDIPVAISNAIGNNYVMSVDTINYNTNISWQEENLASQKFVKAQKVTFTGEKLWNNDIGIILGTQASTQNMPFAIASTPDNRTIITMLKHNSTTFDYDMVIAKLTDKGENLFGELKLINNERSDRGYMFDRKNTITATGFVNNQIVVAWLDSSNTIANANTTNLCLQNFSYYGNLGVGVNTQTVQNDIPIKINNEDWKISIITNGQFNFEYTAEISKNVALYIYYLTGEKATVINNISLQEGYNNLLIDLNLPSGTYIIRVLEN